MPSPRLVVALAWVLLVAAGGRADAWGLFAAPVVPMSPGRQCRAAIAAVEGRYAIPKGLLAAISLVESGRRDAEGALEPWPWSINVEGADHVYASQAEAVAAVRAFQAGGARSIDVGCLQVNLMYHPDAFARLEDGFDPARNADYAARFLVDLRDRTGSWQAATASYHSGNPDLGTPYARKVMAAWPDAAAGSAAAGQLGLLRAGSRDGLPGGGIGTGGIGTGGIGVATGAAAGAVMLGNGAGNARLLPMAAGTSGQGLAAYRARAVPVASSIRLPLR